ncbi:MAG: hypothetical protein IIA44_15665, partial [Acidobacteria bacterium]|nr:hypothetical protein [Acidobacteriota bacterium]
PDHDLILDNLMAMGFVRILAGHAVHRLDSLPSEIRLDTADVSVVVDRVKATIALRSRVVDSLAQAFTEGDGMAAAVTDGDRMNFSLHPRCSACGARGTSISPTLFSFNNPRGACPTCNGFGAVLEYHTSLIVPDEERTLAEGAIDPWTKPRYVTRRRLLRDVAKKHHIAFDRPWRRLPARHRELLLEGGLGHFQGVLPFLRALEGKRYKQYIRVFLRRYQLAITCSACNGKRLRPEALAVEVGGHSIADVTAGSAGDMLAWLEALDLTPFERDVASTILPELHARITYLCDVGLGYLTLNRQTRTLSAGEAQRIALANALGANLVDTLYVLDEPSIGLHPYDIDRLMKLLIRLRDAGNTVVVVEHDLAAIAAADFMVELGPAGGTNGGELVYAGPASEAYAADTLTGQYLSGIKAIRVPSARRHAGPRWLSVKGATLHNLRGVDAAFPLGTLIAVTGVSGSGKSTLVHDVLYRQLASRLRGGHGAKEHLGEQVGSVEELSGWEELSDVVLMDQSPIGRSPRSNPITYVKAFDEIRQMFASQPVDDPHVAHPCAYGSPFAIGEEVERPQPHPRAIWVLHGWGDRLDDVRAIGRPERRHLGRNLLAPARRSAVRQRLEVHGRGRGPHQRGEGFDGVVVGDQSIQNLQSNRIRSGGDTQPQNAVVEGQPGRTHRLTGQRDRRHCVHPRR